MSPWTSVGAGGFGPNNALELTSSNLCDLKKKDQEGDQLMPPYENFGIQMPLACLGGRKRKY